MIGLLEVVTASGSSRSKILGDTSRERRLETKDKGIPVFVTDSGMELKGVAEELVA